MDAAALRIGCAGWALPADVQACFPPADSHLARYAGVFGATEINSTFHRPHRASTFARWAASVPAAFRFSVKVPKTITHERRLADCAPLLQAFFASCAPLAARIGCALVQLPPSLGFDPATAHAFFAALRRYYSGPVALEPRHADWFTPACDAWLAQERVARVLADPVRHEAGRQPGGWAPLVYLRLHGSPRTYYSSYEAPVLHALAERIRLALDEGREVWCIFDNTAAGAATANALDLQRRLAP